MDGEESEGDGAGDVATIGVDISVEIFQWAGAIGRAELEHVVHAVDDLVQDEDDFGVDEGEAFEGAFDAGFGAAEGEECFCGAEGRVGFGAGVFETVGVFGGVDVDVYARFDAGGDAAFHFVDLDEGCGEGVCEAGAGFDWGDDDLHEEGDEAADHECNPSFQVVFRGRTYGELTSMKEAW